MTNFAPVNMANESSRQIAFFKPADDKGKWHAAWMISGNAVCGSAAPLSAVADRVDVFTGNVHPIICRKCYKTTRTGSGKGYQQ